MTDSTGRRSSPAVITATALIVMLSLAVGGSALANWQATGSGAGSGAGGVVTAVTLSPGTAAADLYPGKSGAVSLVLTNPNSGEVRIASIALDTTQGTAGFAVDSAHSACPTSSFTFTTQTNNGAGWTLPVSGVFPATLPNALTMAPSAANACQGVTVTAYLKAGT